jgi:outer membrane protein assembly factor BamB
MARNIIALLACFASGSLAAADWTQFRGPDGNGIAIEDKTPAQLSHQQLAWKVDLPGRGLSSPVVIGDRIFLTASSGQRQNRLHVLAFDARSGRRIWQRTFWATGPALSHPKSCMAAPTPASDGRRLVVLFATNDLVCVDLEGNVQWVRSLFDENPKTSDNRGLASSPVIAGDTAVVQMDTQNDAFAVGIDLATGKNRWHVQRSRDINWSTPIVLRGKTPAEDLVLLQGTAHLTACAPATGKEVWKLSYGGHPMASSCVASKILYVPGEKGLAAFELSGRTAPKQLWEKPKLNPDTSSPLALNGHVHVLRGSILATGDAKTGELTGQLRLKGQFSSSLVSAGGLLYCFNESGLAQVVKPGEKDGTLVGSRDLGETILCTPAIAGGALYVRSDHHMWKFGG